MVHLHVLPLLFAAASIVLLLHLLQEQRRRHTRLPARPKPSRLTLVQRLLNSMALPYSLNPSLFSLVSILSGALAVAGTAVLRNSALAVFSLSAVGLPLLGLRWYAQRRAAAIDRSWGKALVQLAKLAEVYSQPLPLMREAQPLLPPQLRAEIAVVLGDHQANVPLPDALHRAAARLADNWYGHQLAELAGLTIQRGTNLSEGLQQLVRRYEQTVEITSARRVRVSQSWNFAAGLAVVGIGGTLGYALLTGNLVHFVAYPMARGLLAWAVISTVVLLALPNLLRVDDLA